MNVYSHKNWVQFRAEVIKLHGEKCVRCFRSRKDGIVLQVHHKSYLSGRLPWEYPHSWCETLCKGCHAQEHGRIMPQKGWELLGSDDLGDLIGNCELCGTGLRYVYAIFHPQWVAMAVGTDCCDKLTGTKEASEYHDCSMKERDARARFISSAKWKERSGNLMITREGIKFSITPCNDKFRIIMNGTQGKIKFDTISDAKEKIFNLVASGEAKTYIEKQKTIIKIEFLKIMSQKS